MNQNSIQLSSCLFYITKQPNSKIQNSNNTVYGFKSAELYSCMGIEPKLKLYLTF